MNDNTPPLLSWWQKLPFFSTAARANKSSSDVQADQARRSAFLRVLNRAWLGMGGVALVIAAAYPQFRGLSTIVFFLCLGIYVIVRALNQRGHVRAAATVFSVAVDLVFLAIFLMLADEQGMEEAILTEAPALMMMGLAVLFAGALIDVQAAFAMALANSMVLAAIVVAAESSDPRVSVHVFWWMLATTVWLYERTLANTFAQLNTARAELETTVNQRTAQLSRTLEEIETILDTTSDVIVLADAKGDILKTNSAFDNLLGSQIDRAIEDFLRVIPSYEEGAEYAQALLDVICEAIPRRIEAKILLEDGSLLDADVVLAPVRVPDDECAGVLLSLRDITRIKDLDRFKMRFVANTAHDLSNPLAALKTRLYLLKHAPNQLDKHLAILDQQTMRMERLVDDLRTLSALDRGAVPFKDELVDFNALVAQAVETHQPMAVGKGLTLSFEPDLALQPVHADSHHCERIVVNLTANALNYTPPSGQVTLATRIVDDRLEFSVKDTGIGITPEDLPHIFDRFYRGERIRKTDAAGTGLGLAIVKELVEAHGGTVAVESALEQGSTFTVSMPLAAVSLE